jgi:hypothetical protein
MRLFKKWGRSIKRGWLKLTGKKAPKPVYRQGKPVSKLKHFHPLAKMKEDLNLFYAPFKFAFDKNHFFIVHFTAGWWTRKMRDFAKRFLEKGLNTMFIDGEGVLWQQSAGDRCGYHTGGAAKWNGKKINKCSAGVEIANAGLLKEKNGKFYSWFKAEIPREDVRIVTKEMGYIVPGPYQKYSEKQEATLAELLAWVIAKGLPKENILGHDAIRPYGHKNDPGGSLSMPLGEFVEKRVLPLVEKYRDA